MSTNFYRNTLYDYRFLINKGYPERGSIQLVGDRYRLTKIQRNCLYRGVSSNSLAQSRSKKLVRKSSISKSTLSIDWYNVVITIESYLKGIPVFIGDDNIVRDAAGNYGSYRQGKKTQKARTLILNTLPHLNAAFINIYLDEPVSRSGETADMLRNKLTEMEITNAAISVVKSADYMLKRQKGIIVTSDTVIIDSVSAVFDLSRYILENEFNKKLPDVLEVLTRFAN